MTDRDILLRLADAVEAAAGLTPAGPCRPSVELIVTHGGDVLPRPALTFRSGKLLPWWIDRGEMYPDEWRFADPGAMADRFLALVRDGRLPPPRRRKAVGP